MRKALAVGIDNYPFAPLNGCTVDADAFSQLMENHEMVDEETNFHVQVEKNISTSRELRKVITQLFSGDEETVLFYFSGHGILTKTGGYILTPDFEEHNPGVSMDEILILANESKSKDKIILLDCCNSGSFGAPRDSGGAPAKIERGVTILTASNENESALQVNGRGVFTNLLLDALGGGAADLSGRITPGSVYAYIDQALGPWDHQRPVFKTNVSRFTVLRKVTPQVPKAIIKKLIIYFKNATDDFPLNPSFEYTNTNDKGGITPFANSKNVAIFKDLQKLQSVGLIVPVDAEFMYYAAMEFKSCKLTTLGQHYWRLVKKKKF